MEKLEEWHNQIALFPKLKIKEAQVLYQKALDTKNETLKKQYIDELILGTLYVVYEFVKRNELELFRTATYDINDIMSAFNEAWIKKLYRGELLKVNRFSLLFTSTYFKEVYYNLGGEEISINDMFGISADLVSELLVTYIEFKNTSQSADFMDLVKVKYYQQINWSFENVIRSMIPLFEKIYNILISYKEDLNLPKTKMLAYLKLVISLGILEPLTNTIAMTDMEDKILQGIVLKKFREEVVQVFENEERTKQIIQERYGLGDNEPLNSKKVGDSHGISLARVNQIEAKALRKLRRNRTIRKYREEY